MEKERKYIMVIKYSLREIIIMVEDGTEKGIIQEDKKNLK